MNNFFFEYLAGMNGQDGDMVPTEIEFFGEEAEFIRQCAAEKGVSVEEFLREATADFKQDEESLDLGSR